MVETATVNLLEAGRWFFVQDALTGSNVFMGKLGEAQDCDAWFPGRFFYRADFSACQVTGHFKLKVAAGEVSGQSFDFEIGDHALAAATIPAITGFFRHQRAASPQELEADQHIILFGSTNTVDLRGAAGGDALGDVRQILFPPGLREFHVAAADADGGLVHGEHGGYGPLPLLDSLEAKTPLMDEAVYGADYLMRSLSPQDYFYETVFSYFKKDPEARRVVGLLANSVTTSDYQCAYREGGGMAIAALTRISEMECAWGVHLAAISGRGGTGVRALGGEQPEV